MNEKKQLIEQELKVEIICQEEIFKQCEIKIQSIIDKLQYYLQNHQQQRSHISTQINSQQQNSNNNGNSNLHSQTQNVLDHSLQYYHDQKNNNTYNNLDLSNISDNQTQLFSHSLNKYRSQFKSLLLQDAQNLTNHLDNSNFYIESHRQNNQQNTDKHSNIRQSLQIKEQELSNIIKNLDSVIYNEYQEQKGNYNSTQLSKQTIQNNKSLKNEKQHQKESPRIIAQKFNQKIIQNLNTLNQKQLNDNKHIQSENEIQPSSIEQRQVQQQDKQSFTHQILSPTTINNYVFQSNQSPHLSQNSSQKNLILTQQSDNKTINNPFKNSSQKYDNFQVSQQQMQNNEYFQNLQYDSVGQNQRKQIDQHNTYQNQDNQYIQQQGYCKIPNQKLNHEQQQYSNCQNQNVVQNNQKINIHSQNTYQNNYNNLQQPNQLQAKFGVIKIDINKNATSSNQNSFYESKRQTFNTDSSQIIYNNSNNENKSNYQQFEFKSNISNHNFQNQNQSYNINGNNQQVFTSRYSCISQENQSLNYQSCNSQNKFESNSISYRSQHNTNKQFQKQNLAGNNNNMVTFGSNQKQQYPEQKQFKQQFKYLQPSQQNNIRTQPFLKSSKSTKTMAVQTEGIFPEKITQIKYIQQTNNKKPTLQRNISENLLKNKRDNCRSQSPAFNLNQTQRNDERQFQQFKNQYQNCKSPHSLKLEQHNNVQSLGQLKQNQQKINFQYISKTQRDKSQDINDIQNKNTDSSIPLVLNKNKAKQVNLLDKGVKVYVNKNRHSRKQFDPINNTINEAVSKLGFFQKTLKYNYQKQTLQLIRNQISFSPISRSKSPVNIRQKSPITPKMIEKQFNLTQIKRIIIPKITNQILRAKHNKDNEKLAVLDKYLWMLEVDGDGTIEFITVGENEFKNLIQELQSLFQ
ncbi:hypothetical protein PPERSA_07158 [Pseudocohnilembus persalinus]|uniref:Uncharacterized protein n=1 Tax=Pseudocohnilembus persalinus TaxID=266149 RepID=A0A0V0QX77_PSEPJ|nr:hypothetical protein PPERSA_07158 [Pseudocohnilembus persalinus]|eukprot:KRX06995.1 hypothetical protein PPERSA_07158 [Pseudocohnilembus persalinus]